MGSTPPSRHVAICHIVLLVVCEHVFAEKKLIGVITVGVITDKRFNILAFYLINRCRYTHVHRVKFNSTLQTWGCRPRFIQENTQKSCRRHWETTRNHASTSFGVAVRQDWGLDILLSNRGRNIHVHRVEYKPDEHGCADPYLYGKMLKHISFSIGDNPDSDNPHMGRFVLQTYGAFCFPNPGGSMSGYVSMYIVYGACVSQKNGGCMSLDWCGRKEFERDGACLSTPTQICFVVSSPFDALCFASHPLLRFGR